MKITFVPDTAPDAIDWAGSVQFVAETPAEVQTLAEHFKMFDKSPASLIAYAKALEAGTLEYTATGSKKSWSGEARPYFECIGVCLPPEFLKPYKDAALRYLGWDMPDGLTLDLTAARGQKIGYTHTVTAIRIEDGCIVADMLKEDYSAEKAEKSAADYLGEEIGDRKHEPEYIACGNGTYKPNPKYLHRYPSSPAFGCEWLWNALVAYWEKHEATDKQKAVIAAALELAPGHGHPLKGTGYPTISVGFSIYYADPKGTCNYDGKGSMASVMRLDEFAKLGNGSEVSA